MRATLGVWLLLMALSVASIAVLRELPYSTSWIVRVGEAEVLREPVAPFRAGPLTWDLGIFRSAPELQPFRDVFGPACSKLVGVDAARCVTDILKAASPRGEPQVEFVDADFDPAGALRSHMGGAPGHCTARSAITATALLSLGVPARVIQVLPERDSGHNLIEVWDPEHQWLLFDPFYDSSFLYGGEFLSAVKLSQVSDGLSWRRLGEGQLDPNRFAGSTIHYPEPWLYTRVGPRCARTPFRGCFAQVGPGGFAFGTAQRLALGCGAFFGVAFAAWTFLGLRRLREVFDARGESA